MLPDGTPAGQRTESSRKSQSASSGDKVNSGISVEDFAPDQSPHPASAHPWSPESSGQTQFALHPGVLYNPTAYSFPSGAPSNATTASTLQLPSRDYAQSSDRRGHRPTSAVDTGPSQRQSFQPVGPGQPNSQPATWPVIDTSSRHPRTADATVLSPGTLALNALSLDSSNPSPSFAHPLSSEYPPSHPLSLYPGVSRERSKTTYTVPPSPNMSFQPSDHQRGGPPHHTHDHVMDTSGTWIGYHGPGRPADVSPVSPRSTWHDINSSSGPTQRSHVEHRHRSHGHHDFAQASRPLMSGQPSTSSASTEGSYNVGPDWNTSYMGSAEHSTSAWGGPSHYAYDHSQHFPMMPVESPSSSRAAPSGASKRKSSSVPLSPDEEERDDGLDETGDDPMSRQDKRRQQNKLAQRAFRARTKVQTAEVNSQIVHLMQVNESQSRRLEEMTQLVAGLQQENLDLKLAVINGRLPADQQITGPRPPDAVPEAEKPESDTQ